MNLHTHSTYSDGLLTPTQLIEALAAAGRKRVALTDHDTIAGLRSFLAAARRRGLSAVPGVELTVQAAPGVSAHLLGLWLKSRRPFYRPLAAMRAARRERIRMMLRRLRKMGYKISEEDLGITGTAGRPHLARALVAKGYFKNPSEALEGVLSKKGPIYEPNIRLDIRKAIDIIRRAGGTPVLAHPGADNLIPLLPSLVRAGIKGVEVEHPEHTKSDIRRLKAFARKYGLITTGGTDYHGRTTDVL